MDEAIRQDIEVRYQFSIGPKTAESLKILHGSVAPVIEDYSFEVKGFHRFYRFPRQTEMKTSDIRSALESQVKKIFQGISLAMESLTPELVTDIYNNGMTLVGGGALLKGWPERIAKKFNMPTRIPPQPHYCVIRGMKKVLSNLKKFELFLEE